MDYIISALIGAALLVVLVRHVRKSKIKDDPADEYEVREDDRPDRSRL